MSKDVKLVVNIDAKFDWLNPPYSTTDRVFREQADERVSVVAKRLELAVEVLISEFLKIEMERE